MSGEERGFREVVPARQTNKPYLDSADIVIIGNGIAGLSAALEARRLSPDKRIVIITNQTHPTINTPALKQFAIGKLEREQLLAYPVGTERQERIHIVMGHVEEIHARSRYVTLRGNRGFGYRSLLIAAGSRPMGLDPNLPGRDFDGVMTLHRLQDYLNLRRRLNEVSEAAVIGGGAHAIETVMGLLHWGIHVHWLIRGSTFMTRILDETASETVLDRVRRAGVSIYTETEAAGVVGRVGCVAGVITNQQEMIPCQLVLMCTGTQPVTTLAERCSVPMRYKRGILVDEQLRSSVPHIYAAGDVAALKNPQTGAYEPRAQWYAAVSQGRIAGAILAGQNEQARQLFGVQWHATHLGELSMLTVGDPLSKSEKITTLTDRSQGGYRRMTLAGDRLVGYLSLNSSQPDSLAIKRIIDEGHSVRDMTKELLKGTFDARKYLSCKRSRAAQGMLATGKVPALNPLSQVQLLPVHPDPLTPLPEQGRQTDKQPAAQQEEISPFMGNLPALSSPSLPIIEEVNPFTGNLPTLSEKIIESRPVRTKQNSQGRGLWTYSNKEPQRRPSHNLWSYIHQESANGEEKR